MPVPCGIVHPNVCRQDLSQAVLRANAALLRVSTDWAPGVAVRFEVVIIGGQVRFFYRIVACREGARLVFAKCYVDYANGGKLELYTSEDQGWDFAVSEKVLLDIWAECNQIESLCVVELQVQEPATLEEARDPVPRVQLELEAGSPGALPLWTPADGGDATAAPAAAASEPSGQRRVGPDFRGLRMLRRSLDPTQPVNHDELEADLLVERDEDEGAIASLEEALGSELKKYRKKAAGKQSSKRKVDDMIGSKPLKRKRRMKLRKRAHSGKAAPMTLVVAPAPVPAPSASASAAPLSPPVAASSSAAPVELALAPVADADAVVPPPPPPPVALGVERSVRGERGPRESRSTAWGPFTVAPIVPIGQPLSNLTGWGVTCFHHSNAGEGDDVCKRQLMLGKRNPMTSDECRTRLKKWLLLGTVIAPGPESRTEHMSIKPRDVDISEGEAEMDRQAAAMT